MIRILFFWLIEFVLLMGIGILFQRLFLRRGSFGIFDTFWLGLMALVGALQLLHLAVPINGAMLLAFTALGAAGWFCNRSWRADTAIRIRSLMAAEKRLIWGAVGGSLLIALLAAAHSAYLKLPLEGDTALYHWNIVRWYNEYSTVPGLANLHDRLGFNSSYLLWAALVDNFWSDRRSAVLMPGFLVVVMAAQWLCTLLLETRRSQLPTRLFTLLTLPYVISCVWNLNPALYQDTAQTVTQLVLVRNVFAWFCGRTDGDHSLPATPAWCGLWMGYAALAFTFKLSGVLLPPLCLALTMWILAQDTPHAWRSADWWKRLVRIGVLPGVMIAGYLARNVVLSGWLLFPSPTLNLHLPWSVPAAQVHTLYETYIRDWARLPGAEGLATVQKGFWYWFPKWHQIFRRGTAHECLWIGLFAAAFWAVRPRRKNVKPFETAVPLFLMAFGALNLILWFTGAPDLRFGEGLFWCWMAVALAFAIPAWIRSVQVAWGLAIVIAAYLFLQTRCDVVPVMPFSMTAVARAPSADLKQVTVPNGQTPPLVIYLNVDPQVLVPGDSPLPAGVSLNPDLMWREPGNLRQGFWQRPPAAMTAP